MRGGCRDRCAAHRSRMRRRSAARRQEDRDARARRHERQKTQTRAESRRAYEECCVAHVWSKRMVEAMEKHLPRLLALVRFVKVREGATGKSMNARDEERAIRRLIETSVSAFFYNDLLAAGRELLRHAKGSFGLVLSHTLDAKDSFLVAARGQTMSVAFYPHLGAVTFGSEQARPRRRWASRRRRRRRWRRRQRGRGADAVVPPRPR